MKKIIITFAILSIMITSVQAQSKLEQNFAEISKQILENLNSYFAVRATMRGVHDYDYKLTDYSSKGVREEVRELKDFEVRLHKYFKSNLSKESDIDLQLLKSNVDIALYELSRAKTHIKNPYLYVDEAVNGIYTIVSSHYAPMGTRVHNIIARLKVIPDLFKQAQKNLKEPDPIHIRLAREYVITGIDFFRGVENELVEQFPELAQDIHRATDDAVASMTEFDEFLSTITPGKEGTFAIGKQNFNYKLQYEYFIDFDSDSLLKIGEAMLAKYKQEYNDYQEELANDGEGVDSVFVLDCITRDDIMRYYQWETDQLKIFLKEKDLMTIPDDIGEVKVIETPEFLTNTIGSYAYQPPGVFSPDQTGYFFVRPIPKEMDEKYRESQYRYIERRGFRGVAVHEAYPGHHLQFQMASRVTDPVRKFQESACYYEGWAMYCEEMMFRQGLYGENKRAYLRVLGGLIFRAARIVVDVKLHTGQFSRDEAVQWMAEAMDSDTSWIATEVDRYTLYPTIQMSYLVGKLELLDLLNAYKKAKGEAFSLKQFHDDFLATGAVPPMIIWDIWDLKR